jgi:RNA polymerase sigma factor (sigma-70 family)
MHPPLTLLLDRLRRLAARPGEDSDAALLGRFARLRDEEAFAALVARHGPMVLSVCWRVLGDAHAAEDAFQATFLVLARKAGALRRPRGLPAWLYGVAHRVALKARTAAARRHLSAASPAESETPDPRPDPLAVLTARDLLRVLEEEVQRLPGVYRMPVVLCCLEGLSQEEAARRLEWTAGSLKGRLERGRAKLHARLARRGLMLAATLAAAEVLHGVARAQFSPALAGSVARAAVEFTASRGAQPGGVSPEVLSLAHRGLQGMYPNKLKLALVLFVAVGVTGTGLGWRKSGPTASSQAAAAQPDVPAAAPEHGKPAGGRAGSLDKARAELRRVVETSKQRDDALSAEVVEARQRLVEIEERLRALQAEPLPDEGPDSLESRARKEEVEIRAQIFQSEGALRQAVKTAASPDLFKQKHKEISTFLKALNENLECAQDAVKAVAQSNAKARESKLQRVIEMRKQMVRLEENIRALERQRSANWADDERRRDAASERVRVLEGSVHGSGDAPERSTQRRLDAAEREIADLRREIQRLRADKKE